MPKPRMRTLRLVAILRELASLGFRVGAAAEMVGISEQRIYQVKKQFGLSFPGKQPRDTALFRAVRKGYEAGLPIHVIAERLGKTEGTVRVYAHRLGLQRRQFAIRDNRQRGYVVPAALRAGYNDLRHIGLTYKEAAVELGLAPRG